MNKLLRNTRGGNALGVIGIVAMILIIDGVMLYFASQIGYDINTKEYSYGKNDCNCGVLTCQEYGLIYGDEKLTELCNSQQTDETSNIGINIITGFKEVPFIGLFIAITNIILAIALVIIIRGGSG